MRLLDITHYRYMYKAPNGDEFYSKAQYDKWFSRVERAKKNKTDGKTSNYCGRKNKSSRHRHSGVCPECGKRDNLMKDYKGNVMCPNCFRLSLD